MNRMEEIPDMPESLQNAILALLDERARQIFKKGFTAEHDDAHTTDQLISAAGAHLCAAGNDLEAADTVWPFPLVEFNPEGGPRKNLIKAGALILAELERLERAEKAGMAVEVQS